MYSSKKAAEIILEDLPSDFDSDTDMEESDEEGNFEVNKLAFAAESSSSESEDDVSPVIVASSSSAVSTDSSSITTTSHPNIANTRSCRSRFRSSLITRPNSSVHSNLPTTNDNNNITVNSTTTNPSLAKKVPSVAQPPAAAQPPATVQPAAIFIPNQNIRWSEKEKVTPIVQFNEPQGPAHRKFLDCNNEGDYFLKFIDSEIRENLLVQTNLYITQRQRRVTPVTEKELFSFLGINLMMGYHTLPSITSYWSTSQDLTVPIISNTMSRNRFSQILANLHNNDTTAIPANNRDKLYKLRPFIDKLNDNFMKLYNVNESVSIDESMILFKGRSSMKQYNPMKPIKRGYKVWARADMDGYMSKFSIYQGKNGDDRTDAPNCFGLGERVVIHLSKDLFGKKHKVYFDNYFSSIPLAEYLLANNTYCCGTIRTNRKFLPTNLKTDKELQRGEFDSRVSNHGISIFKWMDNKSVTFVSNFHGTEVSSITRRQKDGSKKQFSCPEAVYDYNKSMGGVDKADFYCSIYGTSRKNVKWWHRIFFGLLDRALTNAYIVHGKVTGEKCTSLNFRRNVSMALITLCKPPKIGRPINTSASLVSANKRRKSNFSIKDCVRLQNLGTHWPIFGEKRGRCEVCSNKKVEARPYSSCSSCKMFLCIQKGKNCFAEFHGL